MPLTDKGDKIKRRMEEEYGKDKGESVFYASANAGKITGVRDAQETSVTDRHLDMHQSAVSSALSGRMALFRNAESRTRPYKSIPQGTET